MSTDHETGAPSLRGFLISDLQRDGALDLMRSLSSCFDMLLQPAIFVTSVEVEDPEVVAIDVFHARHLRNPLPSEIGIALAHRSIYEQMLLDSTSWAVVFEDDARVLDIDALVDRLDYLTQVLPGAQACVVNINHKAATRPVPFRSSSSDSIWRPIVPTYTTTAYLLNLKAAEKLLRAQSPVQAQADWPVDCRQILFLQESKGLVEPRPDIASVADPYGTRTQVPRGVRFKTWSWLWYFRHRRSFKGPRDYWHGVLLPRLMRHLYRSA